jgi:transposase
MIIWDDWGMAKGYRPVNRDQPFLFPPAMRDWLPEDHPVWLVIRVVERHLDTRAFHALRKTGGAGAAGFDPDMLVTLLVWAYAHQVTSSRRIEQLCRTDVAFMVICGLGAPDHATVARFRAAFPQAIAGLFAEVLALCARLGMGRLGVVALDGTKIRASASKSASKAEDTLRKMAEETVARHGEADAAEDALFGDAAGDEVPGPAWSPRDRDSRIAAALAGLAADREAADREQAERNARAGAYLEAAQSGQAPAGGIPAGAQVAAARARLERAGQAQRDKLAAWQAQRDAEAAGLARRPPGGKKPLPPEAHGGVARARAALARAEAAAADRERKAAEKKASEPGPRRNVTDPDSRLMKTRDGFIQGYNAQNLASEDGLVIGTALTQDPNDMAWLEPMMAKAAEAAALITAHAAAAGHPAGPAPGDGPGYRPPGDDGQPGYAGPVGLLLADAGYRSEDNIKAPGPPRLIATGKHHDLEQAAAGSDDGREPSGEHAAAMAALLKTEDGIAAYRQRGHIAETPHAHIKHNMAFRQLTMRGLAKASAEWVFAATVCNLTKAITAGHLTSQALDNLAGRAAYPPANPATT